MAFRVYPYYHPWAFSLLCLLLLMGIQAASVIGAQSLGLSPTGLGGYTGVVMTVTLVVLVSALGWWGAIGFRAPTRWADLALYLPALVLPLGNISFGISFATPDALLAPALLAATSAFVEEVIFRGVILVAFLPGGKWKALLVSTFLFGFIHSLNLLAGYEPLYVIIQIGYALAIGFGFGAMALTGRLLWPLVIAHGLGNFIAFINQGGLSPQFYLVAGLYIVLYTVYGLYRMRRSDQATLRAASG